MAEAVRFQPDMLAQLDAWIDAQPDPKPNRQAAIRRLVQLGFLADLLTLDRIKGCG